MAARPPIVRGGLSDIADTQPRSRLDVLLVPCQRQGLSILGCPLPDRGGDEAKQAER